MKTNLLKLTCTLVAAMACVSVNAQNYCGYPNEEDVTWEFNDNQLVFQGTGAIKEYSHDMPTAYPWFAHHEDVQSVIIGEGITSIPAWAFAMHENLRSIQLPSTLKTIGWSCLEETNVWNVALPEGLEKIESYAFMMTPFSSVSIPSTVTEIGERAFGYCDELLSIGCYADAPPTLGDNAFGDSPIATVYVKSENTATYKVASGWADFGDKIQSPAGYCGPNGDDEDGDDDVKKATWTFDMGTHTLTISGTKLGQYNRPWNSAGMGGQGGGFNPDNNVGYPCGIYHLVVEEGIAVIPAMEFYMNLAITDVTLPSTLTSIGMGAFGENFALKSVTINATTPPTLGEDVFMDMAEIPTVYVPAVALDTYKTAAGWSTYADKIVAQGDAPATTTTFTYTASEKVTAFDDITYFTGATGVASHDFADGAGTVVFNGTVTAIATNAVASNTSLTGVVIPNGVTTVGIGAFSYCSNLASVTLPDGLQTLDQGSFAYTKISTVTIPGTVESINAAAFMGCASLTGIDIPNSVTSLGNNIFLGCSKLEYAHLGSGITAISRKLFDNCTRLASIVIPDGVTVIGAEAFMGCSGLETVIIGSGVAEIEDGSTDGFDEAFQGCTAVTDVYCYADAAVITWAKNSNTTIFKSSKSTRFHVTDAAAWTAKFPDANVTFAGDLVATRPATNAVTDGDGTAYWSTYYNSTQDVVADANTEVYQVSLSGTSLTLTKVADRIVNAGQGVVMKSTAANIVLLTAATQSATSYAANSLTGTDTQLTNPGNAYVLGNGDSGVGFYRLSDTGTIGAHKAYLTYDGATARDFLGFDAETTGIHAVQGSRSVVDGYYNLSGQHVAQPGKGLYIVNGKKFVIK